MGLASLIILLALTALYLNSSLENRPEILGKITNLVKENMKYAHFVALFSLVALVICWFKPFAFLIFMANLLILVMLAPFVHEKYSDFLLAKGGANAREKAVKIIEFIKNQEEHIAYLGLGISALMFLLLF